MSALGYRSNPTKEKVFHPEGEHYTNFSPEYLDGYQRLINTFNTLYPNSPIQFQISQLPGKPSDNLNIKMGNMMAIIWNPCLIFGKGSVMDIDNYKWISIFRELRKQVFLFKEEQR